MIRRLSRSRFALGWLIMILIVGGVFLLRHQGLLPRNPTPRAWAAPPVLVQLYTVPGYVSTATAWSNVPDFVLYADGRVITTRYDYTERGWRRTILQGQLTPSKLCSLLVQIEQDGFFDFDPSAYVEPQVTDSPTTFIEVHGWRERQVDFYALDWALQEATEGSALPLPVGLDHTYQRLSTYEIPGAQPFLPDRYALAISPLEDEFAEGEASAPLWPLSPSLEALRSQGSTDEWGESHVVVEGELAVLLRAEVGEANSLLYREGEVNYEVLIRPLFPLERVRPEDGPWRSAPDYEGETRHLDCATVPIVALPLPTLTPATTPTARPTPLVAEPDPLTLTQVLGKRDDPGQVDSPWDIAVTAQGEVAVADADNHRIQYFGLDGTFLRAVELPGERRPYGLGAGLNGTLLVLTSEDEVLVLGSDGSLLDTFSGWPAPEENPEGGTPFPTMIAQGPDGRIYIGELLGRRVIILGPSGTLEEIWQGPTDAPFASDIQDLDVDAGGNLYVGLNDERRILHRSPTGEVTEISDVEVWALATGSDGTLYFLDREVAWTINPAAPEQAQPIGEIPGYSNNLAVAPDGSYLALLATGASGGLDGMAVARYLPGQETSVATFGKLLLQPGQFGGHFDFGVAPAGDVWLIESGDSLGLDEERVPQLIHLSTEDEPLGTFARVGEVAFTCDAYQISAGTQTVAISDPCAARVLLLNEQGELLVQWGERGPESGQFNLLADVALAPDEASVYVLDNGNRRLSQWSLAGALLGEWGSEALGVRNPVALGC